MRSLVWMLFFRCGSSEGAPVDGSPTSDAAASDVQQAMDAGSEMSAVREAGTPGPNDVVIDPSITHQKMDGFGASDAWQGTPFTTQQADLLFDPVKGIGLSLLRVGIDPNGGFLGAAEGTNAKMAYARGAVVWAAPWSPPAGSKDNNNTSNGGHLLAGAYDAWATKLAAFATMMQQQGVPLFGVSAQNEPDFVASYLSCIYSAAQMNAFIAVLGPKLAALNPKPKLIAPEPDVWSHLWVNGDDYGDAILKDSTASSFVDVLATHDYGHAPIAHAQISKPIWETEVAGIQGTGNCPAVCYGPNATIDNGILVAQWIRDAIVVGGASAWHYWWVFPAGADNEGLFLQNGTITKRLFTLGNFSKFVRPGWVRADVSGPIPNGVSILAFENPKDQSIAIVIINANGSPITVPLFVAGTGWPSTLTPWTTSAMDDLAMKNTIGVSTGHAMATLDGASVTTLVGKP